MTEIKNRLLEIFNENQSIDGMTGFKRTGEKASMLFKHNDMLRKRKERAKTKPVKKLKEDEIIDPKTNLNSSELRFTLKEAFANHLINYLDSNKRKHLFEACKLLKEYPKLQAWVKEESQKHLPKNSFHIYGIVEHLDEEVGSIYERIGNNPHVWSLNEMSLENRKSIFTDSIIMECKVSSDKIIMYIPAFTKIMEELIFSGKIEEPVNNVIRLSKQYNEVVTDNNINKGLITKINKGD